jgi:hypothetical protein
MARNASGLRKASKAPDFARDADPDRRGCAVRDGHGWSSRWRARARHSSRDRVPPEFSELADTLLNQSEDPIRGDLIQIFQDQGASDSLEALLRKVPGIGLKAVLAASKHISTAVREREM